MRWIVVDDASARWPSRHRCSENYVFFRGAAVASPDAFPSCGSQKRQVLDESVERRGAGQTGPRSCRARSDGRSRLQVTIDAGSTAAAPVISVSPGIAIAPNGEELIIFENQLCTLSASVAQGFVTIRLVEQATLPSRITEGVGIEFLPEIPPDAIAIARLARKGSKWVIDRKFKPIKARSARS